MISEVGTDHSFDLLGRELVLECEKFDLLLLRLQDESSANRVRVVKNLLDRFAGRLAGHFTVATETGVSKRGSSTRMPAQTSTLKADARPQITMWGSLG